MKKGHRPLVSIVMIFLNAEKFLREALESVVAQTYPGWELMIVDDGSHDGSSAIARRYAKKYPAKIHYLEHAGHKNQGMSASRNLGIRRAHGELITFLDSDDVWWPEKLEGQVSILESRPEADFLCNPAQWWYSWTGKPEDAGRDFVQNLRVPLDSMVDPPALLIAFLRDEWASLCDIVVRRHVIERVGGYEESFRGMYEDQAFHAKLCSRYRGYVSAKCWYRYRQHPDACTAVTHRTGVSWHARAEFLSWLEGHLTQSAVSDVQLTQELHKLLFLYRHPRWFRISRRLRRATSAVRSVIKSAANAWGLLHLYDRTMMHLHGENYRPPAGRVRFGHLRRTNPVGARYGFDRGLPVDRYYIESFLSEHASDIRGRVLEVSDDVYTRKFGGGRVLRSDVLHAAAGNPKATLVADLTSAGRIPSNSFDCLIVTQTLQFIYDVRSAIRTLHRILKPGGVLLATVPGISQVIRKDRESWGEYWRFTTQSVQRLFGEVFPSDSITVAVHGNVLTSVGFLHGLASQELTSAELEHSDPDYELLITVRAVKAVIRS